MRVSVVSFAGNKVASIDIEPTADLLGVRDALREAVGWRRSYARILFGTVFLTPANSLQEIGAVEDSMLTLVVDYPLRIAVQGSAGVLEFYDSDTGACVHSLDTGREFQGGWSGLALSPDGRCILPLDRKEHTGELRCLATGRRLCTLDGHEGTINSAAFAPDGKCCLTGSDDGTAKLWRVATGECVRTLKGNGRVVFAAAFSPDGLHCITACWEGGARLWSAAAVERVRVLNGQEEGQEGEHSVYCAAFSPDGRSCITGSSDQMARLWSVETGECERVLRGHENRVYAAAYSPDGLQTLTGALDRTARLWRVATGECVHVLRGHEGAVMTATFSPDGSHCLTASVNGTARLWSVAEGECLRELQTVGYVAAFVPETFDVRASMVDQAEQRMKAEEEEGERVGQDKV